MLALACGVFVSIAVCSIYHICLVGAALLTWRSFRWKELPLSAKWLLMFVMVGILSTTVNAAAMDDPARLLKIKYPLFGVLGIFLMGSAYKRFLTPCRIEVLLNLFRISITVASVYGAVKALAKFDLLTFSMGGFPDRSSGFTGVMRYSHGLQMVLVVLSALLIHRRPSPQGFHRGLLLVAFVASLIGLWASGTRGAIVGFLCAVPFVFFLSHRRHFWLSSVVCWPLAILIVAGNYLRSDAPQTPAAPAAIIRGMSGDDRLHIFAAALYAVKERPLLGFGPGQFKNQVARLRSQYHLDWKGRPSSHAHNIFLETAANLGMIGLAALIAWLVCWVREVWSRKDLLAQCVLPFICAFIVGGQSEYLLDANNAFMVFFAFSLSSISLSRKPEDANEHHSFQDGASTPLRPKIQVAVAELSPHGHGRAFNASAPHTAI